VINGDEVMGLPEFVGDACDGCEKCVAICPGLAVTLLDYRKDAAQPTVIIPYEFSAKKIKKEKGSSVDWEEIDKGSADDS
jgi:Fe-S-cluster-containing hydrogenase component 2